jgi:hypothetical protein
LQEGSVSGHQPPARHREAIGDGADAMSLYAFGVMVRPFTRNQSGSNGSPMNVNAATLTEVTRDEDPGDAASRTTSVPEQHYLTIQAARVKAQSSLS